MSKKPLIVLEGIEGSGKPHHINPVAKYLIKNKKNLFNSENQVATRILKRLEN